jgi:hypothetical protein
MVEKYIGVLTEGERTLLRQRISAGQASNLAHTHARILRGNHR